MSTWYRTGTVTVIGGSPNLVFVGALLLRRAFSLTVLGRCEIMTMA